MWWCAPRILNDPVRWRYSVLNRTVRSQMAEMFPLASTGVSRSTPTRPDAGAADLVDPDQLGPRCHAVEGTGVCPSAALARLVEESCAVDL